MSTLPLRQSSPEACCLTTYTACSTWRPWERISPWENWLFGNNYHWVSFLSTPELAVVELKSIPVGSLAEPHPRAQAARGSGVMINPRRACAARVTVVVLCVCVFLCVQAAHLRLTQLSDKLDILTDLVSCWLQNKFGVFRIMASFRR